ncbi:MAG: hypothetical protein FK734_15815 [Asgard group archaeon]|nr:hypothetical protein [Asgard group archaeon]
MVKRNSAQKEEMTQVEMIEKSSDKKSNFGKIFHQIVVLSLIHLVYIIMDAVNAFQLYWIAAIVYSIISIGTIAFVWMQWDEAKYLIPIPFISLSIVGALMNFPLIITIIFGLYCIFYFVMLFMKKSTVDIIITIIFSGLTLLLLTCYMTFNQGIIRVNNNFNIITLIIILWFLATSAITIYLREKYSITVIYCLVLSLVSSILPFIRPEGTFSNVFSLVCGIILFGTSVISIVLLTLQKEFKLGQLVPIIVILQVGAIIFSYSFFYFFEWLTEGTRILIVDYGLFIPLAIFTAVSLTIKYTITPPKRVKGKRLEELEQVDRRLGLDFSLAGIFGTFVISSLVMMGWFPEPYNLVKVLVVSVIFFGCSITPNFIATPTVSLVCTFLFTGLMLRFFANVNGDIVQFVLMGLSAAILAFAVINELFLLGDPLTTSLSISGSAVLMISSMIYFDFFEIWVGVIWAGVGLVLFAFGIIFSNITLRRIGLSIILFDILKSIADIIIQYRDTGWQMGVGFMILAFVLLGCIYLFRWSEKKEKIKIKAETAPK